MQTETTSWAEGANVACREALDEVESLGATTPEEEARVLEEYNKIGRRLTERLRQLTPSASQRGRARRMIEAYAAVIPVQEQLARAIQRGDDGAVDRLVARMQSFGSEGDRLALELGANECAKEASDTEPDPDVG